MSAILGVFKNRWLINLLGILAVAVLIWFAGPLLAFAGREPLASETSRLLTIAVMVVLWGLYQLRKYLLARRQNSQMLEGLKSQPPDPVHTASAEEIAILKERFDEAILVLKKAKLKRRPGLQFLYQLPWYIIIGPPGAGKTTALLNSGLSFPLAERFGKDAIRGVGGTRNCDWWFTDEAVLLDTAGRYTTQDSHQDIDSAAWTGFLTLLKKYRHRRPINGVLIAISLADLLQQSEAERAEHARAIRQRIQELHQQLGIRFPIYVLFTKSDLVAGFTEFFDDLGQEERAQVWGMTFPMDDPEASRGVVESFALEFDALEQRLNARLLERLQQERDGQHRDLIYAFPLQFASLKGVAERFLREVFQPSRFEERALLRGVYFTSGTQEGTPIDRLLGSLAATFGLEKRVLPSFAGRGKSYFLTRLFRDVIFQESGLAGANLRLERQRAWLQRGAYAGALLLTIVAAAAWFTSYTRNQAYIGAVSTEVQTLTTQLPALSPAQREVLAALPLLDVARNIPAGYQDRNASAPLLMGFGLYQGDKLGTNAAIPAYRRLLNKVFLPRIMLRLEEQLRQTSASPDYLYEALKVYLMLGDPAHFDAEAIKAWLALDWEQTLSRQASAAQRQALAAHLEALLEQLPVPLPFAQDADLIRRVRQQLARAPLAQRIYGRLKQERLGADIPPFRVSEAAGRDAPLVFVRTSGQPLNAGIPGLYTYAGYHEVFLKESGRRIKELVDENWILGPAAETPTAADALQRLNDELRRLYLEDYAQQWLALLADLDVAPLPSLQQAVAITNVLSGPDSPLRKLLEAVERQTSLERDAAVAPGPGDKTATKAADIANKLPGASSIKDKLRQLIGQTTAANPETAAAKPVNSVETRFEAINRQIRSPGGAPPPLDKTLSLLNELFVYLNAIASAADRGDAALSAARNQAGTGGDVIGRLKLEAARQPPPLNRWLQALAEDAYSLTIGGMRAHLNAIWTASILPFCQQGINDRYPLIRASPREVTLDDFGRFFGPGGLMDDYFQKYLLPFVDTSQSPWRWRADSDAGPGLAPEVLAQFQRAAAIKQAFFSGSSKTPAVRFELKPISMDPEISQFLLTLDGQQVTYTHGPIRPSTLQWPGPEGSSQVQIQFSPPVAGGRSGLTQDGPWAWFRLLDQSDIKPTELPERFIVTFQVSGRQAHYELRASSAFNPFRLKELEQFRCPQRL